MNHLYSYTDFRQYLLDYFQTKKEFTPCFSLQLFANKAGFKARDFILRVMKGSRNLSQSSILMLSKAMSFSEKETDYFVNLVGFNQARTIGEKDHYFRKLSTVCPHGRHQKLRDDQFGYFSEWYHTVLRSVLPVMDFKDDHGRIGAFCDPPISVVQVRKSLGLLLDLGLLKKNRQGKYSVTSPALTTGDEVKSVALGRFHKKMLELASRAIDAIPAEQRDISGVTMSLSKQGFNKVKERTRAFRQEVLQIAEHDKEEDRAYQLAVQFFPVTKRKGMQ